MFFLRKRKITKKGDVGQVFIYILTILIMGLMLFFGIKWILLLMSTQSDVAVAQLKLDLETSFEKIRPNTGTWEYVVFNVPTGLKKVCFLDQSHPITARPSSNLCTEGEDDYNVIMCNVWRSNSDENILFDPPVSVSIYVKGIKIDSTGYKCFFIEENKFKVKLTGLGVNVRVS